MRPKKRIQINHNSEFELDLAPLLAVMVKLVPVLLISSAFVQMMVVDTELPQAVAEAIQRNQSDSSIPNISVDVDPLIGFEISISKKGNIQKQLIPLTNGRLDFELFHKKMITIKNQDPEVFKVELNPHPAIPFKTIVKIMDELRQSNDVNIKFPLFDPKLGSSTTTSFMFPEVIFTNILEDSQNE